MKLLTHVFIHIFLVCNSINTWAELSESSTDPYLVKQKEECYKRANKYWDEPRARCVEKAENKAQRAEESAAGNACLKLTNLEQRKACFMEQAREKSGNMNSEPEKSGGKTVESVITHAYTIMSLIQMFGQGESNCTSRTIFGVTSLAGSLSDIYLRIQSKKKMKKLQDKFEIDLKTNRYDAQVKALEYLKEEQETIAGIASNEAKRHMVMMAGYGVALGVSLYEGWGNPTCVEKPATPAKQPPAEQASSEQPPPANNNSQANNTPTSADNSTAKPITENQEAAVSSPVKTGKVSTTELPPASETGPTADPKLGEAKLSVGTNTKGTTYVNGTVGGQKIDVVGSKVYTSTGTLVGSYDSGTGIITVNKVQYNASVNPLSSSSMARSWQGSQTSLNKYGSTLIRGGK